MNLKRIFEKLYDIIHVTFKSPLKGRLVYDNHVILDEIHILATGPSFKDTISEKGLEYFKGKKYFAVNDFAFTELFTIIKPQYYILVDPAYWNDPSKTNAKDLEYREKIFQSLISADWDITLLVPTFAIKVKWFAELMGVSKHIAVKTFYLYQMWDTTTGKFLKYMWRKNFAATSQNVLGAAIYTAINIGFKNIYLYGTDHNWTKDLCVNEHNEVCTIKRHFFDEEQDMVPWMGSDGKPMKMAFLMKCFDRTFKGYDLLEWYAKENGCNVYNCCRSSFIDSFKKITI